MTRTSRFGLDWIGPEPTFVMPMKTPFPTLQRTLLLLGLAACSGAGGTALGQGSVIGSFSRNGELVCTNLEPGTLATVEWAPALDGRWANTWAELTELAVGSNGTIRVSVPMFYRVMNGPATLPAATNVTAAEALALVVSHPGDPDFLVLDVRTPSEYTSRHLKTALNVNFNSTAFEETLTKLDRKKTYLVYCASGNRSRQAAEVMRRLRFMRINNMTEGFSTFAALPGAGAYLEP